MRGTDKSVPETDMVSKEKQGNPTGNGDFSVGFHETPSKHPKFSIELFLDNKNETSMAETQIRSISTAGAHPFLTLLGGFSQERSKMKSPPVSDSPATETGYEKGNVPANRCTSVCRDIFMI